MSDIQIYTKLSSLPSDMKTEVSDFIDFLKSKINKKSKNETIRIPGKAKGLIQMKENFDDPIEGFNDYLK